MADIIMITTQIFTVLFSYIHIFKGSPFISLSSEFTVSLHGCKQSKAKSAEKLSSYLCICVYVADYNLKAQMHSYLVVLSILTSFQIEILLSPNFTFFVQVYLRSITLTEYCRP